jgi:competence protein ComEA
VLGRLQRVLPRPGDGWVPERPGAGPVAGRGPDPGLGGESAVDVQRRTGADVPSGDGLGSVEHADAGERQAESLSPRVRLVPAGRAVAGLALLVALAVAAALVALWLARPREEPLPARAQLVGSPVQSPSGPAAPTASPGSAPSAATPGTSAGAAVVFVHVTGAVRRPGVVELAAGSRVADAVDAAGGVTGRAATSSINLARLVVDGEQVVVLRKGDPAAVAAPGGSAGSAGSAPAGSGSAGSGSAGGAAVTAPVDLNTATLEQLDSLPGIGPVLAQRILDWRTAHGRFSAVDELGEVSGIGEATLADLRPVVRV